MFKSLAASLLLGLALCSIGTGAVAQTDAATAEVLMRESGLWKQLESVGPQSRSAIQSAFSQNAPSVSQADVERFTSIAEEAFAATRLQAVAQSVIAKRMKQAHVATLLAWYRSPLGMSLTKLEEDAASRERDPVDGMRQDRALLASLPAKRQALLKQLAQVTRSAEAMTTSTLNMTVAMQLGLSSAMPNGPALNPNELRKSLEQQRPQVLSAMNRLAIASNARIYESASNAELAKYIAFLKSPAGVHFMDVSMRAVDAAFVDAATELGRSIPGAKARTRT